MGYSDQTIGYDYGISGTSRKLPRPTTAGKPRPTKRDRGHIEGDIKAATRQLEKLQAELASTQPLVLTVTGNDCHSDGRPRIIEFDAAESEGPRICVTRHEVGGKPVFAGTTFNPSDVPAIVAWLNYHFPKAEA